MRSVAEHLWGDGRLDGRSVAIQGVGKVGSVLAELVAADGCRVLVADRDPGTADAVAARVGAGVVAAHDIIATRCDILAPCALGGVLDARTIGELDCAAVVGAANNQLAEEADAARLAAARVLYAPDFVVNAGGIINIAEELHPNGYSASRAHERVLRIADSIAAVLSTATSRGITTLAAARVLAEERLRAA